MLDAIILAIITAALNGIFLSIAFYIGFTKGTRKAVKIVIEEIGKILNEKPELRELMTAILTQKTDPPAPRKIILLEENQV